MRCVAGRREEFPPHLMEAVGRYRHKVFVSHLGWSLRSSGEVEADEFDGPDAVYVSSQDEHGHVNGVARLLPTTAPSLNGIEPLMWDVWGSLLYRIAPTEIEDECELDALDRFAALNPDDPEEWAQMHSLYNDDELIRMPEKVVSYSPQNGLLKWSRRYCRHASGIATARQPLHP